MRMVLLVVEKGITCCRSEAPRGELWKAPLQLTYQYLEFGLGFVLSEGISMSVTVGCFLLGTTISM